MDGVETGPPNCQASCQAGERGKTLQVDGLPNLGFNEEIGPGKSRSIGSFGHPFYEEIEEPFLDLRPLADGSPECFRLLIRRFGWSSEFELGWVKGFPLRK